MSVDGNTILGPIPSGMPMFMVGRWSSEGKTWYFTYTTFDGTPDLAFRSFGKDVPRASSKDGHLVVTATHQGGGWKLSGKKTYGIFSNDPAHEVNPTVYHLNVSAPATSTTPAQTRFTTVDANTAFSLMPVYNNIDTAQMYAGIWYRLGVNDEEVTEYITEPPPGSRSGFSWGITNKHSDVKMDVAFIPFSDKTAEYTESACSVINHTQAMTLWDSWVKIKYAADPSSIVDRRQANCTGKLGPESRNCIFTDSICNNNVGYTYCTASNGCGDCFGRCETGTCHLDNENASTQWYCHDPSKDDGGRDTGIKGWEIILIVILSIMVIVGIAAGIRHAVKAREAASSV